MPKYAERSNLVKDIVEEYLKHLYEKMIRGEVLTEEEKRSITQKNHLVDAVYKYGKDRIIERGITGKNVKTGTDIVEVSRSTVYGAITALEGEGRIRKFDGSFQYFPPENGLYKQYPILKVASNIKVKPLPFQDLAFYEVDERYMAWVVDYVNSQFNSGDIVAVNLGSIMMCIDLQIPKRAKSMVKRSTLQERVEAVLKDFCLENYKNFDDADGYSLEEQEEARWHEFRDQTIKERKKQAEYGGKIKTLKRKIKRKPYD